MPTEKEIWLLPTHKRPKPIDAVPILETRMCICGCERQFRCLPKSTQKNATKACLEIWRKGRSSNPYLWRRTWKGKK